MAGRRAHPRRRAQRVPLRAAIARYPRRWLAVAGGLVLVLVAGVAIAAGVGGATTDAPLHADSRDNAPAASGAPLPSATPERVRTCSIAAAAADPRLMTLRGEVVDADTGDVLFSREGDVGSPPASVLKILTATAALETLGASHTLQTAVYQGDRPGTVVLVGGGDPTLSSLGDDSSVYSGAARLDTLAAAVLAAHTARNPGVAIDRIVLDSTLWSSADRWNPSWNVSDRVNGYMPQITALEVDGDRADPTQRVSARSDDPVTHAGREFAAALGVPNARVGLGERGSGARLGAVESQPVKVLVKQMLAMSDGAIAESLARLVSLEQGGDGSGASVATAIPRAIEPVATSVGLDVATLAIADGSGLSARNSVPAHFVAGLTRALTDDDELRYIRDAFAVAGESGGLKERYTGTAAAARGHVEAKTGYIVGSHTLAGLIEADDGTTLGFAFYALGDRIPASAKPALDELTAAVYACGADLSNE